MSNNKENKDSQQLFSEDITKRLVKKILDDNSDNELQSKEPSEFNIEYEEYNEHDNDYDDYDNDYYDDYDSDYNKKKSKKKNSKQENNKKRQKNINSSHYRKNIEIYGKEFFDDDYDDYYDDSSPSLIGKVISFSIMIILTISTAFLSLSLISTKKELESAKEEIKELVANKEATENKVNQESLKGELDALKDENEGLKQQLNGGTTTNTTNKKPSSNSTSNNTQNNSNNSSSSEYIVKEGDVIWNISKTVYGNGAHYQKILDANGLKETSVLQPGQKLIIPKLN